jgi:hypothetical protein
MMTIITIESDSDQKIQQILHFAEELGLTVKTDEHRVLTVKDVALGFGRKATETELLEYLLKTENGERIDIDAVFKKFED